MGAIRLGGVTASPATDNIWAGFLADCWIKSIAVAGKLSAAATASEILSGNFLLLMLSPPL